MAELAEQFGIVPPDRSTVSQHTGVDIGQSAGLLQAGVVPAPELDPDAGPPLPLPLPPLPLPDADPLLFPLPLPDAEPLLFPLPLPDAEPLVLPLPLPDAGPLPLPPGPPDELPPLPVEVSPLPQPTRTTNPKISETGTIRMTLSSEPPVVPANGGDA